MEKLQTWKPTLKTVIPGTVFASATLNLGPRVRSLVHKDLKNLAWGWCAITALGDFDPDVGGHIILWDLGLIIRFPPGSTILIPSALVYHSNVTIPDDQQRGSFTQFSAGSLFRWTDYGFKSVKKYAKSVGLESFMEQNKERFINGVDMLMKTSELKQRGL